jgi:hypothetical protein
MILTKRYQAAFYVAMNWRVRQRLPRITKFAKTLRGLKLVKEDNDGDEDLCDNMSVELTPFVKDLMGKVENNQKERLKFAAETYDKYNGYVKKEEEVSRAWMDRANQLGVALKLTREDLLECQRELADLKVKK